MLIALAPAEIREFLDYDTAELARVWATGDLPRRIHVEGRRHPELSHSSIYDVLEHALAPEMDAKGLDIWMSALDEFVEQGGWQDRGLEDMTFELMQIVMDFSADPIEPDLLARRALKVLTGYLALLAFVAADAHATA